MTVNELIKELKKQQAKGCGDAECFYVDYVNKDMDNEKDWELISLGATEYDDETVLIA